MLTVTAKLLGFRDIRLRHKTR